MGSVVSTLANTVATASYYLLTPFWLKLWPPIQLLYLICKRTVLRANNLNLAPITLPTEDQVREGATPSSQRTFEGSGNNSSVRTMGMSGCPFARNTPKRAADASVGPDVAQVSEQLLARPGGITKTKPLVNLLGGAWLQFMVHDWFELQKDLSAPPLEFPLPAGGTMPLQPASVSQDDSGINKHDMWWSGAQIYGTIPERSAQLRTGQGGKLLLNPDGNYLALDAEGVELVGFNLNLWSGIQLLHYLLVKEHNAVCDMLKSNHPDWDDDQLFHTARKIITALVARVHTIEWTTAITQHPMGRAAQYILWYGILGTILGRKLLWLTKLLRPLGQLNTLLTGIPGSSTVLAAGQPFAHSEEFVMVYRMHALLPDKVVVKDAIKGTDLKIVDFGDVLFKKGTAVNTTERLADLFTSLGMGHAGSLELRNYPTALRKLVTPLIEQQGRPDRYLDMGAVDVWRSREAKVPLFNDFRKACSMPAYRSFDKLAPGDDDARAALQQLYDNDIDKVDVWVGLLAEPQLPGFIFAESIWSVFLLQTQRRTESDRFLTQDFTPEMYTPEGMAWIENTTMSDILRRHVPETAHWLKPDTNAFIPWDSTNKRKLHEKVLWDLFFPSTVFGWLRDIGYSW